MLSNLESVVEGDGTSSQQATIPEPMSPQLDTSSINDSIHSASNKAGTSRTASLASEQLNQEMLVNESNKIFEHLIKDMLETSGDYIKGEIDLCIADYETLEKMNRTVADKYKEVSDYTVNIAGQMKKLDDSYAELLPMLSQIEDVKKCVDSLEETTTKLDNYSKRLELKFKQFTERHLAQK